MKKLKEALSYISKIHEKGNRFVIEQLNKNGIKELVPSHGDILAVLYKDGKSTMKEIADKIHRTKPNVTVLVNKLERLGYVKREDPKTDSRYTLVILAAKRARDLIDGKPALTEEVSERPVSQAAKEIAADLITYSRPEELQ